MKDRTAYWREYARKNAAKRKPYRKAWAAANRDRVNEYARAWQRAKRAAQGIKPRVVKPKPAKIEKPKVQFTDGMTLREKFLAYRKHLAA